MKRSDRYWKDDLWFKILNVYTSLSSTIFFKKSDLSFPRIYTFNQYLVYVAGKKKTRRQLSSLLSFASIALLTLSRALCSSALPLCRLQADCRRERERCYSACAFSRLLDLSGRRTFHPPDPRGSPRICLKTYISRIYACSSLCYGNTSGNDALRVRINPSK